MKEFIISGGALLDMLSTAGGWKATTDDWFYELGDYASSIPGLGGGPLDEVVRCRNCVHFNNEEPHGCTLFGFSEPDQKWWGYCKWGESND